jgi:hypothetical protein
MPWPPPLFLTLRRDGAIDNEAPARRKGRKGFAAHTFRGFPPSPACTVFGDEASLAAFIEMYRFCPIVVFDACIVAPPLPQTVSPSPESGTQADNRIERTSIDCSTRRPNPSHVKKGVARVPANMPGMCTGTADR